MHNLLIIFILILLIVGVVFIVSMPFAIIGWASTTVVGLFTPIATIGYWGNTGYGAAISIVATVGGFFVSTFRR